LVGDTEIDAGCAANAGIAFIGVSWGYHSPDRLTDMGAVHILSTYAELPAVIARQFS
jgi:phosphoglycolate phosphatase